MFVCNFHDQLKTQNFLLLLSISVLNSWLHQRKENQQQQSTRIKALKSQCYLFTEIVPTLKNEKRVLARVEWDRKKRLCFLYFGWLKSDADLLLKYEDDDYFNTGREFRR